MKNGMRNTTEMFGTPITVITKQYPEYLDSNSQK